MQIPSFSSDDPAEIHAYYAQVLASKDALISASAQTMAKKDAAIAKRDAQIASLSALLAWFMQQLFGAKSERRVLDADPSSLVQLPLGFPLPTPETPPAPTTTVATYERTQRLKGKVELADAECRLQFGADVPVEEVHLPNPATKELAPEAYEVISTRHTYKLCVRPHQYYVKKYVQPVIKVRESSALVSPPAVPSVIEKSYASAEFLSHLLVEKFQYHLPLYRTHQRLAAAGISVHRSSLSRLVHRSAQLLEPVHKALLSSVLTSPVVTIDETPLKVGVVSPRKMHTGYLVPLYGCTDEVVFVYSPTRSLSVISTLLKDYRGTIVTDGYQYYASLAETHGMTHALCWAHTRREFLKAEASEPSLIRHLLGEIQRLYEIEAQSRGAPPPDIVALRQQKALPIVDAFFTFLKEHNNSLPLVPSLPFAKAAAYALTREKGLRVYLDDPRVPIDTNHLEREIRPTAVGRKNWLFCMNDVGATAVAIISSLVRTCVLHDVEPFAYFDDVLQRIDSHPMREVEMLTPRNWKKLVAA